MARPYCDHCLDELEYIGDGEYECSCAGWQAEMCCDEEDDDSVADGINDLSYLQGYTP